MAVARTLDRSSALGWADRAWNRVDSARPRLLGTPDLAQVLADSDRLISRLHAIQARLLTELARPARHDDAAALVEALTSRSDADKHADTDTNRDGEPDGGPDNDADLTVIEVMVAATARRLAAAEVACALRISPQAAANRVNTALELTVALPATVGAMHEGHIDRSTAHMLVERTAVLSDPNRAAVEELILPLAGTRSLSRLRTLTDRAVITTDPDAARRREHRAHTDRDVTHRPLPEGMGQIIAILPAHGALTVHTLLQHLADTNPDRTRTLGARRADALTDLADTLLTNGHLDLRTPTLVTIPGHPDRGVSNSNRPSAEQTPARKNEPKPPDPQDQITADPITAAATVSAWADVSPQVDETAKHTAAFAPPTRQGRPVDLVITLSLSTLAGLDQLPGHLTGHGPITADYARTLAAAARTVTLLPLDPATGTAVGISDRTYRPRQKLRDQTLTLNQYCSWPGCTLQSWRCDLDHRHAYDHHHPQDGGPTALHNIDPQCRWHHLLKTHTMWAVNRTPERIFTITSPSGITHHYDPPEFTLPDEWHDRRTPAADAATVGRASDLLPRDTARNMPPNALRRLGTQWSDERTVGGRSAAVRAGGAGRGPEDVRANGPRHEPVDDDDPPF